MIGGRGVAFYRQTGYPVVEVPVRLPLPPADHQGSIYQNQRTLKRRLFADAEEEATV